MKRVKFIELSARDNYNRQRAVATFEKKRRFNNVECKYEYIYILLSVDGCADFGNLTTFKNIDNVVINGYGLPTIEYKWRKYEKI